MMRIALAQMNPTVGDFPGNTRKILRWIRKAEQLGARLIVFPEMALCGYPVWDLANHRDFVAEGLRCLQQIAEATRGLKITVVLGFIDPHPTPGGRSRNALAWISQGKVRSKYHKRLLPTYDVFLEEIFFEPGSKPAIMPFHQRQVGLTICEDIWDDAYSIKPVGDAVKSGADWIINISASPFYRGVLARREEVARRHAVRRKIPLLYVNQVGAQDDLIFDGRSFLMNEQGRVIFRAPEFKEGVFVYDWNFKNPKQTLLSRMHRPDHQVQETYEALTLGIRDYCRKNNFEKVVLGLSGGIDSALVACLAADALGSSKVRALAMPSPYSSRGSWEDARDLAKRLGIEFHIHPITSQFEHLLKVMTSHQAKERKTMLRPGQINLAVENLQARLRGLELMFWSNNEGRLLLSTGNKSELAVGYCTLYGDMCGGLAVLGDVYKTDVYRLCRYRNSVNPVIPEPILTKAPSAELRPNQKDQDSLPAYEILDEILFRYIEKRQTLREIHLEFRQRGIKPDVIDDVIRKVDHNEYKRRQTPPILRVTEKAWFGRRMPLTNRFIRNRS